ncbi:hypothetical protein CTheo_3873 [Ceratobasidium theobromae]|uniref:Transmembrane protein n=1 Tax=Ceratobasidium theobromae TaxID=1582974 RepID=A0A5N5QM89_9AGAM|nr:hypothetical protein CTheo_3873 [Ceratobasidium theobromae]
MHTSEDAPVTEQTHLLSSQQLDTQPASDPPPNCDVPRQHVPWTYHAVTFAFVFLSVLFCLATTMILTVHSYISPLLRTDPSLLAQRSFVFKGPSQFNVLNYTSDGVWCEVAGAAAIDASQALQLSSNRFTDRLVGWATRQVGDVTVSVSEIQVFSDNNVHLASLELPDVTLPLSTQTPASLRDITIQVLLRPGHNVNNIMEFVSHSWGVGSAELRVHVAKGVIVGGGPASSWRKRIHIEKKNVQSVFKFIIPPIPGLPPASPNEPRPAPDLASLVYLKSYRILPPPPSLRIIGAATLPNPFPHISRGKIGLSLPFVVSLPSVGPESSLPVVRVETAPIALTNPNISLEISGHVLPLPSSSSSIAPVSRFASDFLAARSSPVLITTDFLRDFGMTQELTVQSEFPAPAERPDILRDVQISNMRIALRGEQILASAFVRVHIVPPSSLAAVRVNATRVWPDLLIYDGPAPGLWPFEDLSNDDERWSEPDPMPLPRPLPPTAFARIRPDSWVVAHTETAEENQGEGEDNQGVWVHAQVNDVPLDVLPGRDAELRRFIRKVLFNSGGARAGVAGITGVAARVGGLVVGNEERGELEMFGLPLRGETWVGKKNLVGWGILEPANALPISSIPTGIISLPTPTLPSIPSVPVLPRPPVLAPGPESESEPEPSVDDWPTTDARNPTQEFRFEPNSEELWQVGVAY